MDSDYAYHRDLSHSTWEEVWNRQEKRRELAEDYWNLAGATEGARIIEVGCGPGFFALDYANRVGENGHVTAVDIAPDAIAFLASRDTEGRVDARVVSADARELPEGPFAVAFLTDVLHHSDHPRALLRALRSRAARVFIAEFAPGGDPTYGPPQEHRLPQTHVTDWLHETGWRVRSEHALNWDHYAIVADAGD